MASSWSVVARSLSSPDRPCEFPGLHKLRRESPACGACPPPRRCGIGRSLQQPPLPFACWPRGDGGGRRKNSCRTPPLAGPERPRGEARRRLSARCPFGAVLARTPVSTPRRSDPKCDGLHPERSAAISSVGAGVYPRKPSEFLIAPSKKQTTEES